MDGAPLVRTPRLLDRARERLVRLRWRRRGAWMWPAFIALIVVDALVGHLLPPAGASQTLVAAGLLGLVANLIAVVLLSRPLGMLLRRFRPDLPFVVARDYGGTTSVLAVAVALLAIGIAHRPQLLAQRRTMDDAIARAQAYIGDRAPSQFRRNVRVISSFAIQPGSIYRECVPSAGGHSEYCVIVNEKLPFQRSVKFSGYEPNSVLGAGAG